MSASHRDLLIDRAQRDAAKSLFQADIAQVRADIAERGIGERVGDRVGEAAVDIADEAMELASEHKGGVAASILALVVFVFRGPLYRLLFDEDPEDEDSGWFAEQ